MLNTPGSYGKGCESALFHYHNGRGRIYLQLIFYDHVKSKDMKQTSQFQLDYLSQLNEQQLDALRQSLGKPTGSATKRQLRVWVHRELITFNAETNLYTKTETYRNRTR